MTILQTIVNLQKTPIRSIVPVTGTAGVAWSEPVSLDLRWMKDCTILVGNTHSTQSLDYRVNVYSDYTLGVAYETATGTVVAGDSDQILLGRHAKATVEVKRTGASNSSYNISCITGGA